MAIRVKKPLETRVKTLELKVKELEKLLLGEKRVEVKTPAPAPKAPVKTQPTQSVPPRPQLNQRPQPPRRGILSKVGITK